MSTVGMIFTGSGIVLGLLHPVRSIFQQIRVIVRINVLHHTIYTTHLINLIRET